MFIGLRFYLSQVYINFFLDLLFKKNYSSLPSVENVGAEVYNFSIIFPTSIPLFPPLHIEIPKTIHPNVCVSD